MYGNQLQDGMNLPSPGGFLIVDDVAINIYITREVLLPYGLPIDTAESGFEAIEKIKSGNVYDIIFMDHMMPGMSGPEATEKIRSMGYMGCIVALTANAAEENKGLYVSSGFNRFIDKPVEKEQVDDLIAEFVDIDLAGYDHEDEDADEDEDEDEQFAARTAWNATEQSAAHTAWNATEQSAAHTAWNSGGQSGGSEMPEMTELFILDAEDAVQTLEKLSGALRNPSDVEIELYEITVHGMKSALRNINEQDLSDFALELELAAKSGDLSVINSRNAQFITDLKQLITELKAGQ